MKLFKVLIVTALLLGVGLFSYAADSAGDLSVHTNVREAVAIADASSGNCAEVDDDGYLQVEVAGGITGSFTADSLTVTENTPGVDADNLCKAEDAAHTTADHGVAVLAVRNDTIAALSGTDGDYSPLQVDATGYLAVSSNTEETEDAAASGGEVGTYVLAVKDDALADVSADSDFSSFTVGAEGALYIMGDQPEDTAASTGDYGIPPLAVRNDALAALAGSDGDYANLQVNDIGAVFTTGEHIEDAAHTTGDYGNLILAVRQDTQAALAGTTGDYSPLSVNATGQLVVSSQGTGASDLGKAEDAAHTSADTGAFVLGIRSDTAAATAGADGDYQSFITDAEGHLWVTQEGTVAEDAAHVSGAEGVTAITVRNDTLAALAGTDGDNAPIQVSAEGALFVIGDQPEDSAHTSADYGTQVLAVRNDTIAALGGTDGDYAPLQVDATGYLATSDAAGYAEDGAHTSTEEGLFVLGVRNDALAALGGSDGDYSPVQVSAEGALFVIGDQPEDTAASDGDYGMPILAIRNDALAALAGTDGDYGTLQIDAEGALFATIDDLEKAEDAAHSSGDEGVQLLAVRNDALAVLGGSDGDYAPIQVNDIGAVFVTGEHAEDAAHASADYGNLPLAVRNDALAALCDTDGDFTAIQVNDIGALFTTGEHAEDAATASGDYGQLIFAVRDDLLSTNTGADQDYETLHTNDVGALFVTGEHREDDAHTTADYGMTVNAVRTDELASLAGATNDYTPLQVDSLGALYVNTYQETVLVDCNVGDAQGGMEICPASGGTSKNRVYKITFMDAAAETHTITELSGFTKVYTQAGGSTVIDFGQSGLLQTTANTAISTTSGDGSASQVIVQYSVEGT